MHYINICLTSFLKEFPGQVLKFLISKFPAVWVFLIDSISTFLSWTVVFFISLHCLCFHKLMDLLVSSLRATNIFIKAILKTLSYVSYILDISGMNIAEFLSYSVAYCPSHY